MSESLLNVERKGCTPLLSLTKSPDHPAAEATPEIVDGVRDAGPLQRSLQVVY